VSEGGRKDAEEMMRISVVFVFLSMSLVVVCIAGNFICAHKKMGAKEGS